MDGEELVWTYTGIEGDVRMRRIGRLPDALGRENRTTTAARSARKTVAAKPTHRDHSGRPMPPR
jgi:hypothetical protein